ncbi:MAG: translation initiation factor IF-3 [Kouleothrix sp.]
MYRLARRSPAIRDRFRVNNRIRAPQVRLIDEEGAQLGIVSLREALTLAEQRGLDLMEVAPNAVPPVCRIVDYGKFRYEQSKKDREARKNQKQAELKEVRLKPKTDDHDLEVKAKQARKFLLAGDKVKFTVRFRGREIFHPDIGREMLEQMAEELRDVATVEQKPLMEGRALSLLLAPSTKAKAQRERQPAPAQREPGQSSPRQSAAPVSAAPDGNDDDADDIDEEE